MALLGVCKVMLASLLGAVCIKGDCESPPVIQNAHNNLTGTPPYSQNTTVHYDCELGYNPVGTSRFYSCFGTTWTNGNFRCEQIHCPHVETPENGRLQNKPTYEVGTIIQFTCNEGYAISGQNTMECRIDGEWLPSTPPTCTARDCGEFGSIQDADLFQDSSFIERNHYGSVVQVTCLNGTTIIGPSEVKCQANGEWGLRPTCEDVQCPPYPIPDSPCISELQTFGVYLFISCVKNVSTHFGPIAAKCISGQWDTTEMGCLCDCILPEYNSNSLTLNGLNGHGNLPHATMLDWTCHDTSDKSSLKLVMCLDGKFNIQDDQDNDMIYSNPFDFTRTILPQICNLPTSPPSTTTSRTLSSSFSTAKTSLISILTTGLMTQTTAMKMVSMPFSTTLSSSEMSLRTSLSNSTTAYSTMSIQETVPSQSVTRSSSISTSVTVSQKPIRSSSTLSSSDTISFKSMTSSSKTPQITISTPVTLSPQSITPSFTMSTPVTVSSQTITPSSTMSTPLTVSSSTMSTPVTGSSQSITPSFTMSTPVTVSSQTITPSSTMSTPLTVSSSTMSTPVTGSSQSITQSSTMSTPVTVSSQTITSSSSMTTPVTASSQSITPLSTMQTPVTTSSQSTAPLSTMSTPVTTVPVYSASSSLPTPLNDATTTTTGTYGVQNSTLYNAKDTDSTSRGQIYVTASIDNMSKEDSINSGTIHFDFFLGSSICCIFQMFHILWLKL